MSKFYTVTFPVTGKASMTVEADNEDGAVEQAYGAITIADFEDWDLGYTMAEVECEDGEDEEPE